MGLVTSPSKQAALAMLMDATHPADAQAAARQAFVTDAVEKAQRTSLAKGPQIGPTAQAGQPINDTRALAAIAQAEMLGDWMQTVDISRNLAAKPAAEPAPYVPPKHPKPNFSSTHMEANPLLGKYPSTGHVNLMQPLGWAALHGAGLLARKVSPELQKTLYKVFGALEGSNVLDNNVNAGLKLNTNF